MRIENNGLRLNGEARNIKHPKKGHLLMKDFTIGAQLYTIRDYLGSKDEVLKSLKKLKAIGLKALEVSSLASVSDKEFAAMLEGEGFARIAVHEDGKRVLEDPQNVLERLAVFNAPYAVYPWPHSSPKTKSDFFALAKALDKSGAALAKGGKTLLYHNHALEFERFGKRTALEIIYGECATENLKAELDTHWVQYGGGNPVEWCKRMKGRLAVLHAKDFGVTGQQIKFMEVGSGNLDWKGILKAAKAAGCKTVVIEQDTCPGDPFYSIKKSFEFLSSLQA